MTIDKQPLDLVLKDFTSIDTLKPNMLKPILHNDYVLATNGNILIKAPKHLLGDSYYELDTFPDYNNAINRIEIGKLDKPFFVNVISCSEFIIKNIPTINIHAECKHCVGEGTEKCNLGHEHDCRHCYGNGHSDKVIGKTYSDHSPVKINYAIYNPKFIVALLKVAKSQDLDFITVTHQEPEGGMIAKVNDITILIMSLTANMYNYGNTKVYNFSE